MKSKNKVLERYIGFLYNEQTPHHLKYDQSWRSRSLVTNGEPYYFYIEANRISCDWQNKSFIILKCQEGYKSSKESLSILDYLYQKGYISYGYDKSDVVEILTRN